jgi:hypothetical protein
VPKPRPDGTHFDGRRSGPTLRVARQPIRIRISGLLEVENRFARVMDTELPTPSRKRGGVLVYGWGGLDAPRRDRGKSRQDGDFGAFRPTARALHLEAESRGPRATPTVALAPPAATLSDSRALWLTPPARLTGGLLSGANGYHFEMDAGSHNGAVGLAGSDSQWRPRDQRHRNHDDQWTARHADLSTACQKRTPNSIES